jgi:hypothetical protein
MTAALARVRLLKEGKSGSAGRWRKDRSPDGVVEVAVVSTLLELLRAFGL